MRIVLPSPMVRGTTMRIVLFFSHGERHNDAQSATFPCVTGITTRRVFLPMCDRETCSTDSSGTMVGGETCSTDSPCTMVGYEGMQHRQPVYPGGKRASLACWEERTMVGREPSWHAGRRREERWEGGTLHTPRVGKVY